VTVSWDGFEPGEPVVSFPAPEVGTHTYTVAASDGEYVDTDVVVVTVRDGEPVVFAPRFQKVPARRLVAVRLGSFDDPGSAGPWGVTVKWGTNGPVQTLVDRTADGSLGTVGHRFRNGGLYSLTVTVTDELGKPGATTFKVRVRPPCRVPDVRGKTLTRAREVLKQRSCALGSVTRVFSGRVRAGRIVSQKPRPGAVRATGAKVRVNVSRGPRG
jgi:PASTA domain